MSVEIAQGSELSRSLRSVCGGALTEAIGAKEAVLCSLDLRIGGGTRLFCYVNKPG